MKDDREDPGPPIKWNPFNLVVQDHRDGTIIQPDTDIERAKLVLELCDNLNYEQLMELGAYLIACAFHQRKPTQGTKGCTV